MSASEQIHFKHSAIIYNLSTRWSKMNRKSIPTAILSTLLMAAAVKAQSAPTNVSIPVSAQVIQACSISTTGGLAFSTYDPIVLNATTALNATTQVTVNCSRGSTGVSIGMDNGTHWAISRQMAGTVNGNSLVYSIYQPSSALAGAACTFAGSVPWLNTTATNLQLPVTTANTARTFNVCGIIPAGQNVTADIYTDTVIATINF